MNRKQWEKRPGHGEEEKSMILAKENKPVWR
jgi:hypothetical protein